IAVVGPDADGTDALRREVYGRLLPASVTVKSAPDSGSDLTPLLADRALVDGKPTAYVCEHFACRQPVTTPEDLREEIDAALAAPRGGGGLLARLGRREAVHQGFGRRPSEGDDRLALVGSHGADDLGGGLATGLDRAGVQHRLGGAVRLEPELAVVVATVAAEAARQPPTPRPPLARRRVLRPRAHVGELVQQRVRRRMGESPSDEDVLVGERDGRPPVQLAHGLVEGDPGLAPATDGAETPEDA